MDGTISLETLKHLYANESGQDLIEYALIAALIGLSVVSTVRGLAVTISTAVVNLGNTLVGTV